MKEDGLFPLTTLGERTNKLRDELIADSPQNQDLDSLTDEVVDLSKQTLAKSRQTVSGLNHLRLEIDCFLNRN